MIYFVIFTLFYIIPLKNVIKDKREGISPSGWHVADGSMSCSRGSVFDARVQLLTGLLFTQTLEGSKCSGD